VSDHSTETSEFQTRSGIVYLLSSLAEPDMLRLAFTSAMLGLSVIVVLSIVGGLFAGDTDLRLTRSRTFISILARGLPALSLGVGVLGLSRAAELVARLSAPMHEWPRLLTATEPAFRMLDLLGFPEFDLFLGVCLTYVPACLLKRTGEAESETLARRQADQTILSGARHGRGLRLVRRGARRISARTIVLCGTLAATGITPAIILTLGGQNTPIGPAIVSLADELGDARARAARLALTAISVNLAALAWASTGRRRQRDHRLEAEYLV
jgi:hypothetical protein